MILCVSSVENNPIADRPPYTQIPRAEDSEQSSAEENNGEEDYEQTDVESDCQDQPISQKASKVRARLQSEVSCYGCAD